MVPFVLPNILKIAEWASNEEYVKHILPYLTDVMKLREPVQVIGYWLLIFYSLQLFAIVATVCKTSSPFHIHFLNVSGSFHFYEKYGTASSKDTT